MKKPKPKTYDEAVRGACQALAEMLIEKHHDYGHNLAKRGEVGILIRVEDKCFRIDNLLKRAPRVTTETRDQTWGDIAGYAIQAQLLAQDLFYLPMAGEKK